MELQTPDRNDLLAPPAFFRKPFRARQMGVCGGWSSFRSSAVALICAASASTAHGAEWRITPRLGVTETYTDNVRLAPRGQEQSDWVTEVAPGVSVVARGARLQLQADYAFLYKAYVNNSSENGHNHSLASNALWDVWNKEFFLAAGASIAQQNISTLGPQAQSNANLTDNRTEVRQANVSPYWVRNIGTWGKFDARYAWSRTEASGDFDVYNNESNTISLGLSSGPEFGNFGWGISYRLSKYKSSENAFENREAESYLGSLRYKITPTFALTGTLGHESNDYPDAQGASTSGTSWSFGGDWAPSSRTRVAGSFGERYFGKTYKFDASHRTRLTTWTLGYSEDVSDTASVVGLQPSASTVATVDRLFLSRIPDPRERQVAVQTFISQNALPLSLNSPVEFLTNQVRLDKRLQGGFGMLGTRGTLLVNLFWQESENLSGSTVSGPFDPFAISDVVEQVGYSVSLSWRLSQRTAVSSSLGQTWNKYKDTGREDADQFVRVGLSHQIQTKVRGAIDFRVFERDSDDPTSSYRERAVVGTLNMAF